MMVKNPKCVQKSKILSKFENLVKIRKFVHKSKILSKIENFVKNRQFCQKSKIRFKIENLIKNLKFWSKIENSYNTRIVLQCKICRLKWDKKPQKSFLSILSFFLILVYFPHFLMIEFYELF